MPVEMIFISLERTNKCINVLIFDSPDDKGQHQKRRIDIKDNGIRWIEREFEQFTPLGQLFEIDTNQETGITVDKLADNLTGLKLSLFNINDETLEQQTVHVGIKELRMKLIESTPCGLHCSKCHNELVAVQRYSCIRRMPLGTILPLKYFCPGADKPSKSPAEDELYYGLNYIVISPKILSKRVIYSRGHIHCSRCLQLVGESLCESHGEQVALQMYVDTLWVSPWLNDGVGWPVGRLELLFSHLSPPQLMLHLLQDAAPISEEETRLFLKTVDPDGQLTYMLILVDNAQLHLLRSTVPPTEDLNIKNTIDSTMDSSGESSQSGQSSSEAGIEVISNCSNEKTDEPRIKRLKQTKAKPVHVVKLRGYRGCRVNYRLLSCDQQLAANTEVIDQWLNEGTPMLRISYEMMMGLVRELNSNMLLVAVLERSKGIGNGECTSYMIFEPDSETSDI